jgi:hypothetical protein
MLLQAVREAQLAVAPLHISDDGLATLIHMLMFEPGQFESRRSSGDVTLRPGLHRRASSVSHAGEARELTRLYAAVGIELPD